MTKSEDDDDTPVLTPKVLLAYRRASGGLRDFPVPQAVIFAPQKSLAKRALRTFFDRRVRGFLGEFYLLNSTRGRIGLSTGFGIGAPGIAGLTDEFCALGVERFLILGMAGGLQADLSSGDLILCAEAIRGDGTSPHYLPEADSVSSSESLLTNLSAALSARNHAHRIGTTWTTDAPFRELRGEVLAHQRRGVLAVDMEAAAMLAVAQANGRSALAAFAIVDSLADGTWKMPQNLNPARAGLEALFESALEVL